MLWKGREALPAIMPSLLFFSLRESTKHAPPFCSSCLFLLTLSLFFFPLSIKKTIQQDGHYIYELGDNLTSRCEFLLVFLWKVGVESGRNWLRETERGKKALLFFFS